MQPMVAVKKLDPRAILPAYGTAGSAGADLSAVLDAPVTIAPGGDYKFHTGLAIAVPAGYAGLVFARSGIATKRGLAPANKVGVIDSDYRGELMIVLHNHSGVPQTVEPGERIAQLILTPYLTAAFAEVQTLDDTARGEAGFGSTGTT